MTRDLTSRLMGDIGEALFDGEGELELFLEYERIKGVFYVCWLGSLLFSRVLWRPAINKL